MAKKPNQEEIVGGAGITVLAIRGILGLVLLAVGVYAVFFVSPLIIGVILLVLGILTYVLFVIIQKRLKLL